MLQTIRNAWKIEELRAKMIFTLMIIVIFRLGNAVPVPYVDTALLAYHFQTLETTILGLYNVMSGGAFEQASIFALSIQPYITSSIVMQLLCVAIPALERLQKEGGEEGKKLIQKITRFGTVGLGLVMGLAYYLMLSNWGILGAEAQGFWPGLIIVLTFTAGSALVMWMGEQITEFGIGNGISLILFAGIVSRFPVALGSMLEGLITGFMAWWLVLLVLIGALLLVILIVVIQNSERKIPVQYAKRVVGRKMYGGQSTHLPIKLSMTGVLPIIFAQALASLPATVAVFFNPAPGGWLAGFANFFDPSRVPYLLIYVLLIIFFSYFYSQIQFNPIEVANNLKKNGGYIPGFRPGKPTQDHVQKILGKITLFGAVYLAVVAGLPIVVGLIPFGIGTAAQATGVALGGTSVIIVVGVALETVKNLENQMLMRHYKGFLDQ
ncbi:MAG: preprotein translocase subunit SecY [Oscillospiraceae bacterium]|nr:preprotein translocase subunit SecY [Oscillospiraceae bacterium]